ncbi:hypothetical protein BAL199_16793 [alpha proteobacterium BAL199]|jgi:hypothetical protein|nr:hypothetical protein BAL199_16793 [alpha proteobacterium BAL199]
MLATMISDPTDPVRALWERMNARDWDGIQRLLDGGFQAVWPQTGERIPTPTAYVGLNRTYPGVWRCTVLAVDATAEGAVARVRISDGTLSLFAIGFYRVMGGRILAAEEYFGDAGPPPHDRSEWTEPLAAPR